MSYYSRNFTVAISRKFLIRVTPQKSFCRWRTFLRLCYANMWGFLLALLRHNRHTNTPRHSNDEYLIRWSVPAFIILVAMRIFHIFCTAWSLSHAWLYSCKDEQDIVCFKSICPHMHPMHLLKYTKQTIYIFSGSKGTVQRWKFIEWLERLYKSTLNCST